MTTPITLAGDTEPFSPESIDDQVSSVAAGLRARISERLANIPLPVEDPSPVIDALCGGKHLRARTLLLIAHSFGGPDPRFAADAAVALELLHTASLVHDDIIDRSQFRRGLPSLHSAADEATAILVADLLIAVSFETAAVLGERAVLPLARAFGQLCKGQLLEPALGWGDEARPEIEDYATLKTGALFGAAFELGAMAASYDPALQDRFRESGERLGLAFQLTDDLLDVRDDALNLGKDHGADLRNGIPTLPLWSAYRRLVDLGETRSASDPSLREALADEAGSDRTLRYTKKRIGTLVEEFRTLLPPAKQPGALDLTVDTVLANLDQFSSTDCESEAP
ncbi:polyprenyl synthetase family protein [Mycolicibacterium boenickei]|uniref:Geranylgeranyl pyrophosphate synthase n=1 Tax=Mycolicibacterium boenickei TaxID=146017 RepID=A0AAX2ZW25_9MYCO|nr:polyprenyl synthetase family protein [Mycolicibacterium boenickei]UNB99438.1 polyprenyl synthetase family protein [Mycolicibacterium boenickei]BBX89078.1 geranylgeranyl pyrophosphate synthase [Mycolicibacterium boenickei]